MFGRIGIDVSFPLLSSPLSLASCLFPFPLIDANKHAGGAHLGKVQPAGILNISGRLKFPT